jgi:hypothetical protein
MHNWSGRSGRWAVVWPAWDQVVHGGVGGRRWGLPGEPWPRWASTAHCAIRRTRQAVVTGALVAAHPGRDRRACDSDVAAGAVIGVIGHHRGDQQQRGRGRRALLRQVVQAVMLPWPRVITMSPTAMR